MWATTAGCRLQLCNTLHTSCLGGESDARSWQHAEPAHNFKIPSASWTDRRHPLRPLHCCGTSAPLSSQLHKLSGQPGLGRSRHRRGWWAPRCLIEGVHHSEHDSGLRERLLDTEAAGITSSGVRGCLHFEPPEALSILPSDCTLLGLSAQEPVGAPPTRWEC